MATTSLIATESLQPLASFHPITATWFRRRFGKATEPQRLGWPEILAGHNTLIAAPTGSGKTLAAFLACLDQLIRQGLEAPLADEVQVVYISPLKALSSDIRRNLEVPLAEIRQVAEELGYEPPAIRVLQRTGDTSPSQRQAMIRRPPHVLVTTPESLYLLLGGSKSREILRSVRTLIVDEIHALARDKRGSHLSLSVERLQALADRPLVRIGLSATQRPIDEIARFLVGTPEVETADERPCRIIDIGHQRQLDLDVVVPPSELSAVCSNEQWDEVFAGLTELIQSHRSTLIFVNTRRLAERVSHRLLEALGEDQVAGHHGSLSRERRLDAEARLKDGKLKAIVATASLELGIDIGFIDLVCQISTPRSIATFLQRVGRSGHSLGLVPKGRLFPLSRDDLMECLALLRAVREGRLDQIEIPRAPLDILAQQIVAAVACEEWDEDALYELCRKASPYRELQRKDFDDVVEMLSRGVSPGRRRGAYLHRDLIHRRLRARRHARITALTCGGAIPETADYRVVTEGEDTFVGTVNEDFAIESMAGDIFLLGNTSWRIRYVRGGKVVVNDANGAPATIPFWLGEAPGRTIELSQEVSRLREEIGNRLVAATAESERAVHVTEQPLEAAAVLARQPDAAAWALETCGVGDWAAAQAVHYVEAQKAALGVVPSQREIVFERFFDESGGMQLVIHAPLGARINRAWGLALRKRFCRSFNFELQAAADDNGIVLSLGPQHSFPIEQMFRMLNTTNAEPLLVQALLAAPMFQVRWRWNVTRALAVLRQNGGSKVPPPLQRFRADDLLSAVFPMQTACLENIVGDIEVPSHPLVAQTVYDCLHEAMDVDRWLALLDDITKGRVQLIARDTREPSPFCYEILNANPYAFLDDAPLEERRARAVASRRTLSLEDLRDLARLDPEAIRQVRAEAWPIVRDADELHDALLAHFAFPEAEVAQWSDLFEELLAAGRATIAHVDASVRLWIAAENWPAIQAVYPEATAEPDLKLPDSLPAAPETSEATVELVRGRLACLGPVTAERVSADLGLRPSAVEAALEALEGEGFVLRGQFTHERDEPLLQQQRTSTDVPGKDSSASDSRHTDSETAQAIEWCERRLLARIHRLTLEGARRQVQPVAPEDFMRFLLEHQCIAPVKRLEGRGGAVQVIDQLQGFELPAGAWEQEILPLRVKNYDSAWLDELTHSGEFTWGRLQPPRRSLEAGPSSGGITRTMPISVVRRSELGHFLPDERTSAEDHMRSDARLAYEALVQHGALFFEDLLAATELLPAQLEGALSQLAALGLVTSDGYDTIRRLVSAERWRARRSSRSRRAARRGLRRGGRWSRFPGPVTAPKSQERHERWARQLLRRYGVVFRDLLARESAAPQWRELRPIYRRLEAIGEIRGGRFIGGVAGEQYATAEAVSRLREVRDSEPSGQIIILSAADPLNLSGIITSGPRIAATNSAALALRDGRLVATRQRREIQFHEDFEADRDAATKLTRALRQSGAVRMRKFESG